MELRVFVFPIGLGRLGAVAGARVLDLGSGTGILAIAALKLGAARALCVDIDPAAVAAAQRNCALNGCAEQVDHVAGTLAEAPAGEFDLVLANLYGDVLLGVGAELAGRARTGAHVLLSGIAWEYGYDVRTCFEAAGCVPVQDFMLPEYWTMLLHKGAVAVVP